MINEADRPRRLLLLGLIRPVRRAGHSPHLAGRVEWLYVCSVALRWLGTHGSHEQVVESGAFLGAQGAKKLVFDQAESDVGEGERFLPCRRDRDDVAAPVCGIALPRDQPAFFELIQQPDDVARIEAQYLAEALLAEGPPLAQEPECDEVPGSEATRRHGGLGGSAADASQVIEQGQ